MKSKEEIFDEAFKEVKQTVRGSSIFFTSPPPTNLVSEYVAELDTEDKSLHCSSLRLWWPLREHGMTDEDIKEFIKTRVLFRLGHYVNPY